MSQAKLDITDPAPAQACPNADEHLTEKDKPDVEEMDRDNQIGE
jgi:hypothetical protein